MTIEVKQLQINSTVTSNLDPTDGLSNAHVDIESVREEILAECRRMIREVLRSERER